MAVEEEEEAIIERRARPAPLLNLHQRCWQLKGRVLVTKMTPWS
jgi:hypothetical protein